MNQDDATGRLERCMALFAAHQRRLYGFVHAMLPSPADADEVVQETNLVVWKKFDDFDPSLPGSDFLSWVFRIAVLEVREFRRRQAKRVASFSPEVLDQLAAVAVEGQSHLEERSTALAGCIEKLSETDRRLLVECYAPEAVVKDVAEAWRRTTTSVYRSLRRIRESLAICIDRRLREAN